MKRILIVEDDRIVASIYRNKLQNDGFDVEIAGDGETATRQLRAAPPDLVLLDLGLPKLNGVEVLKWIRSNPQTAALPVIVFSNAYVTDLVNAAWKAGANKCLTKATCTPRELLDIIHATLAAAVPAGTPPIPLAGPRAGKPEVPPPEARSPGTADALFQAQIRHAFLDNAATFVGDLRQRLQMLSRGSAVVAADLYGLYRSVHSLTGNAGIVGCHQIAQLSAALEVLLKELHDQPRQIGPSPLRTTARAIDSIAALFEPAAVAVSGPGLPPAILALDDDKICRRAICQALAKANLRAFSVSDPSLALLLLAENAFDLVFSDINMPGMNGFEFCAKVRELPGQHATPVIFVTSAADFENRANSKLSGGTDLIAKPFLHVELAVKALTYLYRRSPSVPAAAALVESPA